LSESVLRTRSAESEMCARRLLCKPHSRNRDDDVRKTAKEAFEKIELERHAAAVAGYVPMASKAPRSTRTNDLATFLNMITLSLQRSMADTLSTMAEVDRAVAAIKQIKERTAKLPPVLVEAYKETLEASSSAIVRRFFEGLATQCPDALEYS